MDQKIRELERQAKIGTQADRDVYYKSLNRAGLRMSWEDCKKLKVGDKIITTRFEGVVVTFLGIVDYFDYFGPVSGWLDVAVEGYYRRIMYSEVICKAL